eukprot:758592-Hanusia_phi.AAC.2
MREGKGRESIRGDAVDELEQEVLRCHELLTLLAQDAESFCWSLEEAKNKKLERGALTPTRFDTERRSVSCSCGVCHGNVVDELEKAVESLDSATSQLSRSVLRLHGELEASRQKQEEYLQTINALTFIASLEIGEERDATQTQHSQTDQLAHLSEAMNQRLAKLESNLEGLTTSNRESLEAENRRACETATRRELAKGCEIDSLKREIDRLEKASSRQQSQHARMEAEWKKSQREAKSRESEMEQEVERLKQTLRKLQDQHRLASLELKNQLKVAKDESKSIFKNGQLLGSILQDKIGKLEEETKKARLENEELLKRCREKDQELQTSRREWEEKILCEQSRANAALEGAKVKVPCRPVAETSQIYAQQLHDEVKLDLCCSATHSARQFTRHEGSQVRRAKSHQQRLTERLQEAGRVPAAHGTDRDAGGAEDRGAQGGGRQEATRMRRAQEGQGEAPGLHRHPQRYDRTHAGPPPPPTSLPTSAASSCLSSLLHPLHICSSSLG